MVKVGSSFSSITWKGQPTFRNKVNLAKLCLKMSGTTIKSLTETSLGELVQVGSIVLAHTWKEQPTSLN